MDRGVCTGRELAAVVGNGTFAGLIRREVLSVFSSVYAFIDRVGTSRQKLWPSVRKEIRWFITLLPLLRRRFDAPWSTTATCTDASLWGMGVVESQRPLNKIKEAGKHNDRWRFSRTEEVRKTARASAMAVASRRGDPPPPPLTLAVEPEEVLDVDFPEVSEELYAGSGRPL